MSFNSIWLTLAKQWDSRQPGMAAYARRKADRFHKMVLNLDAEWEGIGVPELRNILPGKTLVDQVLVRRKSEITTHLPGYEYVLAIIHLLIRMICRFPIPKDNSFSSVEQLRAKYKDKKSAPNIGKTTHTKRKAI
jgi:hypothetical protein